MHENTTALVAYGSRYGSTAEIAEAIGETLRARGIVTEVAPADAIRSVDEYGLVVVGGGVYVGRWHGAAVGFLKRFDRQLRDRPTWLFGSGPTGGTPKAEELLVETLTRQPPPPGNVAKLADRIGAREYRTFGGRAGPGMG
jgi:menaquinone-dependent protoporphyrinogen oxidase